MIDWPEALVNEIVKERCVFFLGSGASASAKDDKGNRPLTWDQFLVEAHKLVVSDPTRTAIHQLIQERKYLIALQAIKDNTDEAQYRNFLDKNFNNRMFRPSRLHELIYEVDPRIVITTNFDKLYEMYWATITAPGQGYKVIDYTSNDLSDELRSDTRLIVKAHGSIDRISQMIFTRQQYHAAKRDYPGFYGILRAIFLTNTIVFVGCGMEDPDITLLLEEIRITGRGEKPHYALTLKGEKNPFFIQDWRKTYNISVLEYDPNHDALISELEILKDLVNAEKASGVAGV